MRRTRRQRRNAAYCDIILEVAESVVGGLGRRRRQCCGSLEVLPLMSGFWTKQVVNSRSNIFLET
eukprot:1805135-Heterocapsa_arctica.AAC.1